MNQPDFDDTPNWYDPDEFRVPGTDSNGQHERMWFRLLPGELMQAATVFESKRFPYRTLGDIPRHAIWRHLRWLGTLEALPSVTAKVDMMMEVLRQEEFHQDFQKVFEGLVRVVAGYTAQGAEGEARRVLATIINHVDEMPEGYWRGKYRDELVYRFKQLMDDPAVPILSLTGRPPALPASLEEDEGG